MAVTVTLSHKAKESISNAKINFGSVGTGQGNPDSFKIILMGSSFVFNKISHSSYSDVSASQLGTNYGYTTGGNTLGSLIIAFNVDTLEITYPTVAWTASGGDIGPTVGAIIYDNTPALDTDKVAVAYIDFGGLQTAYDGGQFSIASGKITFA